MKEVDLSDKLNQAKDNVKYLGILEKFIEPLYKGTPITIIETLPALMNAIKMIHTIARYYSGTTAMTNLFQKITNQMITNCKEYILKVSVPKKAKVEGEQSEEEGSSDDEDAEDEKTLQMAIWMRQPDELIQVLHNCIKLNQKYQEEYRKIKEKVETLPRGSHFDFSETQIFWKFDIFERRIFKLIEIFKTKQQFEAL
jgi:dynein heavy chain